MGSTRRTHRVRIAIGVFALMTAAVLTALWSTYGPVVGLCLSCGDTLELSGVPDSAWRSSGLSVHPAPPLAISWVSRTSAESKILDESWPDLKHGNPPKLMRSYLARIEYADTHERFLVWLVVVVPTHPFPCLSSCSKLLRGFVGEVDATHGTTVGYLVGFF